MQIAKRPSPLTHLDCVELNLSATNANEAIRELHAKLNAIGSWIAWRRSSENWSGRATGTGRLPSSVSPTITT